MGLASSLKELASLAPAEIVSDLLESFMPAGIFRASIDLSSGSMLVLACVRRLGLLDLALCGAERNAVVILKVQCLFSFFSLIACQPITYTLLSICFCVIEDQISATSSPQPFLGATVFAPAGFCGSDGLGGP